MGIVALVIVCFGYFDTTASTPHPPLVAWATHMTMKNAVRRAAAKMPPPSQFTAASVQRGFAIYDTNCEACHGGPGVPRAAWVSGMTPSPPFLLGAARQWTPNQLFWIVRHGVRMTGMPAWDQTLSQADVWHVVAFLEALPGYSAADYARLRDRTQLAARDAARRAKSESDPDR
ncbi:cytochrome c [Phenylobacterium sp.]|uniref:c-type cytochrome n=1 Tax=Phenylobacterium sp. TaxID=1871053 RepID=UPI002F3ED029